MAGTVSITSKSLQMKWMAGIVEKFGALILILVFGGYTGYGLASALQQETCLEWVRAPALVQQVEMKAEFYRDEENDTQTTFYWIEASYLYSANDGLYESDRVYFSSDNSSEDKALVERQLESLRQMTVEVYCNPKNELESVMFLPDKADYTTLIILVICGTIAVLPASYGLLGAKSFRRGVALILLCTLVGLGIGTRMAVSNNTIFSKVVVDPGGKEKLESLLKTREEKRKRDELFLQNCKGESREKVIEVLGKPANTLKGPRGEILFYPRPYWPKKASVTIVDGVVKTSLLEAD